MANKNNKQIKKLKRKFSGNQHTSRKTEFLDKTSLEDEKNNPSFSLYKKSTITLNESNCNLFIELQILRSVINMIGICPDCTSKITLKLIIQKNQGFANSMCLICYKCNWTYNFYTSSFISKNDNTKLCGKRKSKLF